MYEKAFDPEKVYGADNAGQAAAPKEAEKKQAPKDLPALEARLSKAQWLGGAMPSDEDKTKGKEMDVSQVDKQKFPYTFAWLSLAAKFK